MGSDWCCRCRGREGPPCPYCVEGMIAESYSISLQGIVNIQCVGCEKHNGDHILDSTYQCGIPPPLLEWILGIEKTDFDWSCIATLYEEEIDIACCPPPWDRVTRIWCLGIGHHLTGPHAGKFFIRLILFQWCFAAAWHNWHACWTKWYDQPLNCLDLTNEELPFEKQGGQQDCDAASSTCFVTSLT